MPKSPKQVTNSSPESALRGYEYQWVWSARRAIQLLAPGTDLREVVVENVLGKYRTNEAADFEGVDLSEYYGPKGTPYSRIILWQMKHGHQRQDSPWTVARMCEGKKNDPTRSVIGRLGKSFRSLRTTLSATDSNPEIVIRIASNRPLHKNCAAALARMTSVARDVLSDPKRADTTKARNRLSEPDKRDFDRIVGATKLRGKQALAFLAAIDTEFFGGLGFEQLQVVLLDDTKKFIDADLDSRFRLLVDKMREAAMGVRRENLNTNSVLAIFGSSVETLFPAKSQIRPPAVFIPTGQPDELAKWLLEQPGKFSVVHGQAGVGKSATLLDVQHHLPTGSTMIVYDCFGGGITQAPDKRRFSDRDALPQLINEICTKIPLDYVLIPETFERRKTWARLRLTLEEASSRLPHGALLVVAVDAADNALAAYDEAPEPREECFVPGLWHLDLPHNVVLVMSCRTHRIDAVLKGAKAPHSTRRFEIRPFIPMQSAAHARNVLPGLSDDGCRRFHDKSDGYPRLQWYWLQKLRHFELNAVEQALTKRPRFGLDEHYDEMLGSARTCIPKRADAFPFVMMELQRPIRADAISGALGCDLGHAQKALEGLQPGLMSHYRDSAFEFRDEDFEDFIRERSKSVDGKAQTAIRSALANFCVHSIESNSYAAQWAHLHLERSGQFEELLQLAAGRAGLGSLDPHDVPACVLHRVISALPVAAQHSDHKAAIGILLRVAKEIDRRSLLEELLVKSPTLAIAHGRLPALLHELELMTFEPGGDKTALEFAANCSAHRELRDQALRFDQAGKCWLLLALEKSSPDDFHIDRPNVEEIVNFALAGFRLHGDAIGAARVLRWIPPSVPQEVAFHTWQKMIHDASSPSPECVSEDALVEAAAWAGVYSGGGLVNAATIRHLVGDVVTTLENRENSLDDTREWFIDFVEAAATSKAQDSLLRRLLALFTPDRPSGIDYMYGRDWYTSYDLSMRWYALRSRLGGNATVAEYADLVLPARFQADSESEHKGRRDRAKRRFAALMPAYILRAQALVAGKSWPSFEQELANSLLSFDAEWNGRWEHSGDSGMLRPILLHVAIEAVVQTDTKWPLALEKAVFKTAENGDSVVPGNALELAELLPLDTSYVTLAERLLVAFGDELNNQTYFARDKIDELVHASEIAMRVNLETSRSLYSKAVDISQRPDWSDVRRHECILDGCNYAANAPYSRAHGKTLAAAIIDAQERLAPYVERHKHLPWEHALGTAACFDIGASLEAIVRWDKAEVLNLSQGIDDLMWGLRGSKSVSPLTKLALLELGTGNIKPTLDTLSDLSSFDKILACTKFEELAPRLANDRWSSESRIAVDEMQVWAEEHACSSLLRAWLTEHKRRFPAENYNAMLSSQRKRGPKAKPLPLTYQEIEMNLRANFSAGIQILINAYQQRGLNLSPDDFRHIARVIEECSPIDSRTAVISGLTDILRENGASFSDAFPELLLLELQLRWRNRPNIRRHVTAEVSALLPNLLSQHFTNDRIAPLLRILADDDPSSVVGPLLRAVSRAVPTMSPDGVYRAANLLMEHTAPPTVLDALSEILDANVTSTHVDDSIEEDVSLARFLRQLMNHPDNRVRWRAFYSARQRCSHEAERFLHAMLSYLDDHESAYWMSAREWLLFLCVHLAHSQPQLMLGHIDALERIALDSSFPHVSHVGLALRALRYLESACPGTTRASELEAVLEPRHCLVNRKLSYCEHGGTPETSDLSFDFDAMDTLRYWYPTLGACFNISTRQVSERAADWIVNRLKLNASWRDFSGHKLRSGDEFLTTNGHGSLPTIESQRIYMERHAMLLTAGELIADLPIRGSEYDDEVPWEEWCDRWILSADEGLSTLRRSLPPLASVYLSPPPQLKNSEPTEWDDSYFLDLIWSKEISQFGLCMAANFHVGNDTSFHIQIRSVFVPYCTGNSLRNALDSFGYPAGLCSAQLDLRCMPPFDSAGVTELLESVQVRRYDEGLGDFVLQPAHVDLTVGGEVDQMDPHWPDVSRAWYLPTAEFLIRSGCTVDPNTFSIISQKCEQVGESRNWCMGRLDSHASSPDAYGTALWIYPETLQDYLKKYKLTLVGQIEVYRHQGRSNVGSTANGTNFKTRSFTLNAQGVIGIGTRSRRISQTTNRRTE